MLIESNCARIMANFVASQSDRLAVQPQDIANVNWEIMYAICRGETSCNFGCGNVEQATTLADMLGRWSYNVVRNDTKLTISW